MNEPPSTRITIFSTSDPGSPVRIPLSTLGRAPHARHGQSAARGVVGSGAAGERQSAAAERSDARPGGEWSCEDVLLAARDRPFGVPPR